MYKLLNKLIKVKINLSLKTKLLSTYFILIFVPLILITMISYNRISKSMEESVLRSSEKSLDQSTSYLEYKLDNIRNVTSIISFNEDIQEVLANSPSMYNLNPLQQYEDFMTLSSFLRSIKNNSDIYRIRLYISEFANYSYNSSDTNFFLFKDAVKTNWYKKIYSKNALTWLSPDSLTSEAYEDPLPVVSVAKKIRDQQDFTNILAILRIDILQRTIKDILDNANTTKSGVFYIINQDGDIIATSGNKSILQNTALRIAAENNDVGEKVWKNIIIDKQKYIVSYRTILNTDWQMFSIISYDEIKEPGENVRTFMLILMIVAGTISYIFAYFLLNSPIKRLRLLANSMNKVRNGDLNIRINGPYNDEIGESANSFNYMVKEMEKMITEQYESGKMIKSLELKALQAQINPHFLYNSLEMINWSAAMKDIPEIVLMVQSLSKFYKLGLSKGKEFISIKDELEHIRAYLDIQNLRFGDVIKLHLDVPADVLDYLILKISLQPIVENSILHGILQKESGRGNIYISASIVNQIIHITVKDDGVGMKQETLENIFSDTNGSEYHGYGLKNINERIKIQFGNQYGLNYQSNPGIGTTVVLIFPAFQQEANKLLPL